MRSLFSYLQKKNCENDEKVMPLFIQRIFKMVLRLHVSEWRTPPCIRGGQHVTDLAQNLKNETSIAKSSSLKIIDL